MATVLVRRGLDDHEEARAFLAAEPPAHDPLALGDVALAVERIRSAVAAQERICVHGDYDVDGISATAVAVLVLRELGATVEWRLPSRFEEGYGLAPETIEQLAEDGVDLVLTVDCGITAVDEVARARELGLDVIVTDHHRPAEALPDCPIVATRPSDYPCPELCGTGVVYTLARALLGRRPSRARARPRSRRPRDDRGRRPARGREPRARRGRPPCAGPHEPSRPAGADAGGAGGSGGGRRDRSRVPPRAADQRGRPPRTTGCRARAPPDRRPRSRPRAGVHARGPEPRAAGRRGADPPRGAGDGRYLVAGGTCSPRLCPVERGVARGRDRDRRLPARRAVPASRRARREER